MLGGVVKKDDVVLGGDLITIYNSLMQIVGVNFIIKSDKLYYENRCVTHCWGGCV